MSLTALRCHPATRAAIDRRTTHDRTTDRALLTDTEPNTSTSPAHLRAEVA
ncbi:hypothetical protein [Iamia sp. SCSIO 61187]|uniref:hypothetical protein n=1 Tax=Iamia sp. SCSIO 61187 TaxID=2722752 RepID=UPI00210767CF|nr:hypothetical protein [Iamia sp. SCSIO 61187]